MAKYFYVVYLKLFNFQFSVLRYLKFVSATLPRTTCDRLIRQVSSGNIMQSAARLM